MSQRTTFTTITPLPPGVSRQIVVSFLHDHKKVIDLNPLVKERHSIRQPLHAAPDELRCAWYSITDHASYLPGKIATGEVTYTWAFSNLPNGLQSHCYAPAGLDIRQRWLVESSEAANQTVEPDLNNVLSSGLCIREDVDIMCNRTMTCSVKKTLKNSHAELVARLELMAQPTSSARAAIHTDTKTPGIITAVGQQKTGNNVRNVHGGAAAAAADSNKHLAVYSWLKSHDQRKPPPQQQQKHSRSSSDRSTSSSGSSGSNQSSLPSPVSSYPSTPSYRNMVISPPTPPYSTPMASPLWTKLQPPPKTITTTPASLSPRRVPPQRPPRPEQREMEKQREKKPVIRLIPEPLRIPRTAGAAEISQNYSPVNINNSPRQIVGFGISPSISPSVGVSVRPEELNHHKNHNNINSQKKILPNPPISNTRRHKFSYDSTSSTENYLVTSPTMKLHNNQKPPPPQHILSQSRDYHEQVLNNKDQSRPPSSPILSRLKKYMGTQHRSFDPFEPHPDYPHMSPYMDDHFPESCHSSDDDEDDEDDGIYHYESDEKSAENSDDAAAREIKVLEEQGVNLLRGDTLDDYYAQYYMRGNKQDKVNNRPPRDYQHLDGKEEDDDEESRSIMDDNDSGYVEHVSPPPLLKAPLPPVAKSAAAEKGEEQKEEEEDQLTGATLSGPFVAAFDEFNICLP